MSVGMKLTASCEGGLVPLPPSDPGRATTGTRKWLAHSITYLKSSHVREALIVGAFLFLFLLGAETARAADGADPVTDIAETVELATEPVEPTPEPTLEPVAETVEPVAETVEPVAETPEPVAETVEPTPEPVAET